MKALRQHDLSAAFPVLPGDEYEALKASIKAQGVIVPITLYEDRVLDGWTRYSVARDLRVPFKTKVYRGKDPVGFVRAANMLRRHLNSGQRAMVALRLEKWAEGPGRPKNSAPGAELISTVAEIAGQAATSVRTIEQAKKVTVNGAQVLRQAVDAGTISVKVASEIAALPKVEQRAALKEALDPAPGADSEYAEVEESHPDTVPWKTFAKVRDELEEMRSTVDVLADHAETASALMGTDAAKEMVKLRGDLRSVSRRRDELLNENATLKSQCKMWRGKFEKLEKETKKRK